VQVLITIELMSHLVQFRHTDDPDVGVYVFVVHVEHTVAAVFENDPGLHKTHCVIPVDA
jgi:hypothetical protein